MMLYRMAQVQRQVAWVTTALKAGRAEHQGAVVDGTNVGTVRILPPWLQKQAGFPGDGIACVIGRLLRCQQTGGTAFFT